MFWLGALYLICTWAGAPMCQEGINLRTVLKEPFGDVLVRGIREVVNLTAEITADFKLLSGAEENLRLLEVEVPVTAITNRPREDRMMADQPFSEEIPRMDVEEEVYPVATYSVPEGFVFVCEICTANKEFFVLWSTVDSPRNVSQTACESRKDLEVMKTDTNVDYVALGFFVNPLQCDTRVVLTPYYLGRELPQVFKDVYGSGYGLLDAIDIMRGMYEYLEKRRNVQPKLETGS